MSSNRCCPTDVPPAKCAYEPTGDGYYMVGPLDSKSGVVLVGDIFGMLPNSKRFADFLASKGFLVAMPDFFAGKEWDENNWPPNFESDEWKKFHALITNFPPHDAKAERAVALLRQLGCAKVGAIGMCWGALSACNIARGKVDAVVAAHPSFFTKANVEGLQVPTCVLPSKDETNMEEVEAAVKALPSPSVFKTYNLLTHGFFGSRFDYDNCTPEELAQLNDALEVTANFFEQTLKK